MSHTSRDYVSKGDVSKGDRGLVGQRPSDRTGPIEHNTIPELSGRGGRPRDPPGGYGDGGHQRALLQGREMTLEKLCERPVVGTEDRPQRMAGRRIGEERGNPPPGGVVEEPGPQKGVGD